MVRVSNRGVMENPKGPLGMFTLKPERGEWQKKKGVAWQARAGSGERQRKSDAGEKHRGMKLE